MESHVSLPGLTVSPDSRVVVRFEISADINITAFAATPKRSMNVLCISMFGD